MIEPRQGFARKLISLSLLFLAVCVFSLGLQAKLSLYKVSQRPSVVSASKLSTEERSAQAAVVLEASRTPRAVGDRFCPLVAALQPQATVPAPKGAMAVEIRAGVSGEKSSLISNFSSRPPPVRA